jgi:hypothetical protein
MRSACCSAACFNRKIRHFEFHCRPKSGLELEVKLNSLSREVFLADDSLGWVYQFWQRDEKERVNKSEVKIGADELAPVTQLFTEDYMVEFLLHNTIGAWWAGKIGAIKAATEEKARARAGIPKRDRFPGISWTYLRFVLDAATNSWLPAAGTFDGWPKSASLIRLLDPCMGSGHFLVFALPLLVRLRMEEEGLSAQAAVIAVLKDNIYGLELDERCTQIAAFNIALTAWRLAGYQALPPLHLACSGLAPRGSEDDWIALAGKEDRVRRGMTRLYELFKDAPVLGSLINPRAQGGNLIEAEFREIAPVLEKVLTHETKDDTSHEMAVTAYGLAKAAEILAGQFTLVTTNVPYLGRGKQNDVLKGYCERVHPGAKADLATCFVERCVSFCVSGGSSALVTPQNWLFLGTYKRIRERLFREGTWNVVAKLGPAAFQDMNWWAANTVIFVITNDKAQPDADIAGLDVSEPHDPQEKATLIRTIEVTLVPQSAQLKNPDSRLLLKLLDSLPLLEQYAVGLQGISPADFPHYGRFFWELTSFADWRWWQSTIDETTAFGGRELVLWWNQDLKDAVGSGSAFVRGEAAWGKSGVVVRQMRHLPCCIYTGEAFDTNCAVVVPHDYLHVPAVWAFCSSEEFAKQVRQIDQKTNVTNNTLVKVPFDLAHWQTVAAEKYPQGLPKPFSSDVTQWLFNGYPKGSDQPLHVAVARLLGYQWPRQTGSSFSDCPALGPDGLEKHAEADGVVCLTSLAGKASAADRLRGLLADTYSEEWSATKLAELLGGSESLEMWLRDRFFEAHCQIFHQHPFVWHVWDGRNDGFHALVNYHKLDHKTLEKLIYSYLGDWISRQRRDLESGVEGADGRLAAAEHLQGELMKILDGEKPYDVFVRWKPLKAQPIGWEPELNDGVRVNIRPWITEARLYRATRTGILRVTPNIKYGKDRGKETAHDPKEFPWFKDSTERNNNVHLALEEKRRARGLA